MKATREALFAHLLNDPDLCERYTPRTLHELYLMTAGCESIADMLYQTNDLRLFDLLHGELYALSMRDHRLCEPYFFMGTVSMPPALRDIAGLLQGLPDKQTVVELRAIFTAQASAAAIMTSGEREADGNHTTEVRQTVSGLIAQVGRLQGELSERLITYITGTKTEQHIRLAAQGVLQLIRGELCDAQVFIALAAQANAHKEIGALFPIVGDIYRKTFDECAAILRFHLAPEVMQEWADIALFLPLTDDEEDDDPGTIGGPWPEEGALADGTLIQPHGTEQDEEAMRRNPIFAGRTGLVVGEDMINGVTEPEPDDQGVNAVPVKEEAPPFLSLWGIATEGQVDTVVPDDWTREQADKAPSEARTEEIAPQVENFTPVTGTRAEMANQALEDAVAIDPVEGAESYKCPDCSMVSYNRDDIANRYCGNCHKFEGDPKPEKTKGKHHK